jgi:hypothetical protein
MSSTTTTTATTLGKPNPLGNPVPPFTPHAISVSLPTWRDNVDYEEGAERVVKAMTTGYPRFFIHLSIQKVTQCSLYRLSNSFFFLAYQLGLAIGNTHTARADL